jgi:hypothetical protein
MATGRDATDVALSTSFGVSTLAGFTVITEEIPTRRDEPEAGPDRVHKRPHLRVAAMR